MKKQNENPWNRFPVGLFIARVEEFSGWTGKTKKASRINHLIFPGSVPAFACVRCKIMQTPQPDTSAS
jgi:hypothetical protein